MPVSQPRPGTLTPTDPTVAAAGSGPVASPPSRVPGRIAARLLGQQAVLVMVVGVAFLLLYAGLLRHPQLSGLTTAVAGPAVSAPERAALGHQVDLRHLASGAAVRAAVAHGDVAAGLVASPTGHDLTLFLAGPGGASTNQAASELFGGLALAAHAHLTTVPLVPLVANDPTSKAMFFLALAETVSSFIFAQALFGLREVVTLRRQLAGVGVFAVISAVTLGLLARFGLYLTPAAPLPLVGVLVLLSLAVSLTARALSVWWGPVGITVATLLATAIGFSTSGGILGRFLLPPWLGELGAHLPTGAALRALLDLGYFHSAHVWPPLADLAAWAAAGTIALVLWDLTSSRSTQQS